MTSLDHVIATFREEATVLRANGHTAQAQSLATVLKIKPPRVPVRLSVRATACASGPSR